MNPIYKFELTAGETTQRAYPIYKDDLAKNYEKESGQEFFRAKLSGQLTFESDDYTFIASKAFDTEFIVEIFISYNAGQSWQSYWRGSFWKTDCEFDEDAQTVAVKPNPLDDYTDILAGLDKEYNLIELAPAMAEIQADKRPMVQVYVPGQSVIGCFLSGMWWEQECEPESNESKLAETGDGKLNFAINKSLLIADVSGTISPQLPDILTGVITGGKFDGNTQGVQDFVNEEYTLRYQLQAGGGGSVQAWYIIRNSDSVVLWQDRWTGAPHTITLPLTVTLTPQNGATGNVTLYIHETPVYSRYICDTPMIDSLPTFTLPTDDIVENNRNYSRVIGYQFPTTIAFSNRLTTTPTQWGLYQPGQYYQSPYSLAGQDFFPVARNGWGRISIWFVPSVFDSLYERPARQPFTIRHAYPLWSVLNVLLGKVAPNIEFFDSPRCSQFLYPYDTNPITGLVFDLLITPKSNIVSAGYDQPAQKAPITLRQVFDMLRNCFRCYWYIDENNLLHIEHISWFMRGGSYTGTPIVGIDLTEQKVTRNGKEWAFAQNKYKFDKPEMVARYQFGWMDDVTQLFEGFPIDIVSKYVNPDNIEEINVQKFTSDIDYILLNPSEISMDGFVLLAAICPNELSETEQYTLSGHTPVVFRAPVPQEWKGRTIKIDCNLERGTGYITAGVQRVNIYEGNNSVRLFVPEDAITILLFATPGTVGNPLLSISYVGIGNFYLPYINYVINGNDHYLQNGYVAFCILQRYYAYDMPARYYSINGVQLTASGIKKLKNQTVRFPSRTDPDLVELVKTNLGNGMIQKLSINLSSRNVNATLVYDTE